MAGRRVGRVEQDSGVTTGQRPLGRGRSDRDDETRVTAEDTDYRLDLLQELSRRRLARNLSQSEVARRMGTTQSAVSDMEQGRVEPRFSTLQRYARILGIRLRMILLDEPVPWFYTARSLRYAERPRPRQLSDPAWVQWANEELQSEFESYVKVGNVYQLKFGRTNTELGDSLATRLQDISRPA